MRELLVLLGEWLEIHGFRIALIILSALAKGNRETLYALFLSGLVCGMLWEFWNYWAGAKWVYTVPILENLKIFEMPVIGYLGFLPFAWEVFAMYNFAGGASANWPGHLA